MSTKINKLENGAYQLLWDGLCFAVYSSKEEAEKQAKVLDLDDEIDVFIEDELDLLVDEIVSKFSVSKEHARGKIAEVLG